MAETVVIGIDEVGRGCVWGPVHVGAFMRMGHAKVDGVKDSKKYSSAVKREVIAARVTKAGVWFIGSLPASAIDEHGMVQCLRALAANMIRQSARALNELGVHEAQVIFDGTDYPNSTLVVDGVRFLCRSEPKADANYYECSAASVIAKVTRDELCRCWSDEHPESAAYQIGMNMGYGTTSHAEAIAQHGSLPDHRVHFVKSLLQTRQRKIQEGAAGALFPSPSAQ